MTSRGGRAPIGRDGEPAPPESTHEDCAARRRRIGHWAAGVAAAIWAVAALHPTGAGRAHLPAWPLWPLPHLWIGWTLADGLRNLALTAPLGAALALAGHRWLGIAAGTAALAGAVEIAQSFVPGRHSSLADVVFNSAGAVLGAVAFRALRRSAGLADAAAGARALVAGGVAAALVAAVAVAARPELPAAPAARATAERRLPWIAVASPLVLEARVGEQVIPAFQRTTEADAIDRALRRERAVAVRWRFTGRSTGQVVPLLRGDDGEGRTWLMGVDGRDLVWRWPLVGNRIGLENSIWRWRDALAGFPVGQPAELDWRFEGAGLEARLVGGDAFRRRAGPGDGWHLVIATSSGVPDPTRRIAGAAWLALVWLPIGLYARRNVPSLAGLGLAAVALLAAPLLGLAAAGPADWAGAVAGLTLGGVAVRLPGRRTRV